MVNKDSLSGALAQALGHALSCGKVMVMAVGAFTAVVLLGLFGWLGGLIKPEGLQWLAWIIQAAGLLGAFLVVVSSMIAVVRMAVREESGDKKLSFLGAIAATINSIPKVLFAVIKPIMLILAAVVVILVLGLIGYIPIIGPIVWGIDGIIAVIAGVFIAYMMLSLLLGVFVLPSIIAEGVSEGNHHKKMFNFIKGHLFPLLGRLGIVVLLIIVFLKIIIAGVGYAEKTARITMIKNYSTIYAGPLRRFIPVIGGIKVHPIIAGRAGEWSTAFRSLGEAGYESPDTEHVIGGWVYSIELGVFAAIVFGIAYVFFATSGYYVYQTLKDEPPLEIKTLKMDIDMVRKKAEEIKSKIKMGTEENTGENDNSESQGDMWNG